MKSRYTNNLIRQGTTLKAYSELNSFNMHIVINLNEETSTDLETVKKQITRIFRKLNRQINKCGKKIKALMIYELNTDLAHYHVHIMLYYPYNIKTIEKTVKEINNRTNKTIEEIINNNPAVLKSINKIKTAIGIYGNGQIAVKSSGKADIDIKPIYNQKELTRYLCKTCNEKIFNYYQLCRNKYIGITYSDYIQALDGNKSLYSQINCTVPHKPIISQPASDVKAETTENAHATERTETPQISKASNGSIVSYPHPTQRQNDPFSFVSVHSMIQETFRPKETPRNIAPTRIRTAPTGFTGYSMYNNKPPPLTRAYRAVTAHR